MGSACRKQPLPNSLNFLSRQYSGCKRCFSFLFQKDQTIPLWLLRGRRSPWKLSVPLGNISFHLRGNFVTFLPVQEKKTPCWSKKTSVAPAWRNGDHQEFRSLTMLKLPNCYQHRWAHFNLSSLALLLRDSRVELFLCFSWAELGYSDTYIESLVWYENGKKCFFILN